MTLYENLLTAFILLGIFVLGYLRMTNKTLTQVAQEIMEIFSGNSTEDLDLKW